MRYTVLMSVYKNDSPEFLKIALKSIYDNQTRKPDEIVIVFDGPLTKQLHEVLDDFKGNRADIIKFFPQKQNRGLGEALRIGSGKCTGDYIFRMDSDDISAPNRFEKQINYIEEHSEIDVLGTDIAEFQSSLDEDMRLRVCPEKHEDIIRMGKRRSPMNHVSVCIKREALIKCGGYRTLLLLEDYYLWLRMIVGGCRLANLHEPLVFVRVGNGFDSKRGAKERITGWKVLQDYMQKNHLITRIQAIMNICYIKVFVNTPPWMKKRIYSLFLRE